MSRTVSPVSGRPYGLAAVCLAWRWRAKEPADIGPRARFKRMGMGGFGLARTEYPPL